MIRVFIMGVANRCNTYVGVSIVGVVGVEFPGKSLLSLNIWLQIFRCWLFPCLGKLPSLKI